MNKIQNKIGLLLFFLIFFGYTITVNAQRMLMLDEAIATALQNNYDIQLAKNDSLIAAIDYYYRNAGFLPTLDAEATTILNNNNQQQTLADGSERKSNNIKSNNIQAAVNLDWVLFDGLKMFATRDKATALLQAGNYALKEQIINTIATVINTYYGIARGKQELKAINVQINLNEERSKLAQYKLDIGTGAKPDVLQSKVDLNEQKAIHLQQETQIDQLKQQLVQAMNSKVLSGAFDIPDTIPVNYNIVLGDLQDGIELTNPSLLLAKSKIDIANYTLKEAKADFFPTISFNSAYNFTETNNKKAINSFSTLFNQAHGYNYGFTASIPIFNQFLIRKQVKKSQLDLSMQQLEYESQRSLLNLYILNGYKNYSQQKKALQLEEENNLLAQENVTIVFQTYKLNAATLVQLREAQLSLAQSYDRLIQARFDAKVSETELMRLKGDLLK